MKKSLAKRAAIKPIYIVLGVGLLVVAGGLVALAVLSPATGAPDLASAVLESPTPDDNPESDLADAPTPTLRPTTEPLAASVNGYTITQSYFSQTVRLNQVLGELSGAPTMEAEETLQRLIRSELILQGAEDVDEPSEEDVESFITSLERSWGVSDEQVVERLQAVGLERSFLEDTIQRLLTVQGSVQSLQEEGHSISEWLRDQQADAEITVYEAAVSPDQADGTSEEGQEGDDPTPTPGVRSEVPDVAPDFTLSRAGGGSFTLAEQLELGPVALVFFERCG